MNKKRLFRFIKRYLIGLFSIYFLLAWVAYYFLTSISSIKSKDDIPDIKMKNQFGELKSFSDYKGKVLLVDFWFQGCQPCLKEMKYFPELLKKYNSELAIMSISIDSNETTKNLLEQKPKPWGFLIWNDNNWTFYNVNLKGNSLITELPIVEHPTYLLFDKNGEFINTPFSEITGVENEINGIFGLDLPFQTDWHNEVREKLPYLIIPYTLLVILILLIQLITFGIKRLIKKTNANKDLS